MLTNMRAHAEAQERAVTSPKKSFADETPKQRKIDALHREIARRYAWDDRERRQRGRYPLIVVFRLRDLENLFAHRYGATLPDDDAGRDDLYVAASHICRMGSPEVHIRAWAALWCPWCEDGELTRLIADVARKRQCWSADALAKRIGLDDATRTLLGIKSIGANDVTKAKRAKRAKRKDAAYQKALRVRAGAKPHAGSTEQKAPWLALGVSRRTYYRKQANGTFGTDSSEADRVYMGTTNQCHGGPSPLSGDTLARAAAGDLPPMPAINTASTVYVDRVNPAIDSENVPDQKRETAIGAHFVRNLSHESKAETPLDAALDAARQPGAVTDPSLCGELAPPESPLRNGSFARSNPPEFVRASTERWRPHYYSP
jgi:hypothetical protein